MFLGKPVGIFTLLDEECTFPQATDVSFVQKIDQHFSKEPCVSLSLCPFVFLSLSYPLAFLLPFSACGQSLRSILTCLYVCRTYIPAKVSKGFPSFSIQHFADTVEYNAQNMIEKNRDNLATGIVDTMKVPPFPSSLSSHSASHIVFFYIITEISAPDCVRCLQRRDSANWSDPCCQEEHRGCTYVSRQGDGVSLKGHKLCNQP